MKLIKNWITEKYIDQEYKRYVLLSYLKEIDKKFNQKRLFPYYDELKEYFNDLDFLIKNINNLYFKFPNNLIGIELENIKLIYNNNKKDNEIIMALKEIMEYSICQFKNYLHKGEEIYDFIKKHIEIEPVGLIPLNLNEGYMFLKNNNVKNILVYYYRIILYNDLKIKYIGSYKYGFINTFEKIKRDIIKKYNNIPNPATYSVVSDIKLPLNETLLPIAKQMIIQRNIG